MRFVLICVLFAVVGFADAATKIYRTVDEKGNVIFTDVPPSDKKKQTTVVEVDPANSYEPADRQTDASGRELWIVDDPELSGGAALDEVSAVSYTSLQIASPQQDEAVRANSGTISVSVQSIPALDSAHKLQVSLDGVPQATTSSSSAILDNVARGTHTVTASIINSDGHTLISSNTVTFHVLRAHR